MFRSPLLAYFALVLGLTSCRSQQARSSFDVSYGVADGQKLLLDVFQPLAPRTQAQPAVLLVHGGGWTKGDKAELRGMGEAMARFGYVAFAVNYRLTTETGNHWPAQIDDMQRAVRWVRAHAAEYGVDPLRIGAFGGSAGGHLVTFLGTTDTRNNSDPALATYSSRVSAVVDMSGPTELVEPYEGKAKYGAAVTELERKLFGKPLAQAAAQARDASPLFLVDAHSAPFLIFHGQNDELVPLEQSEKLHAALQKAGVESKLVIHDEGHGFSKKANWDRFFSETFAFLNSHLHP